MSEPLRKDIPKKFYKDTEDQKAIVASTVGELKNLLSELPDDLRLLDPSKIVVYNIATSPKAGIEELDIIDFEELFGEEE